MSTPYDKLLFDLSEAIFHCLHANDIMNRFIANFRDFNDLSFDTLKKDLQESFDFQGNPFSQDELERIFTNIDNARKTYESTKVKAP